MTHPREPITNQAISADGIECRAAVLRERLVVVQFDKYGMSEMAT